MGTPVYINCGCSLAMFDYRMVYPIRFGWIENDRFKVPGCFVWEGPIAIWVRVHEDLDDDQMKCNW